MFDRILVPLDGSKNAESILEFLGIVAGEGSRTTLVHVLPLGASGLDSAAGIMIAPEQVESYFVDVGRRFPKLGDRMVIEKGDPVEGILRSAAKCRTELIAMATHGRSGLRRLLMGSVAEGVVRQSPLPVLLVRHGAPVRARPIRRILLPLEATKGSRHITATVSQVARRAKAEVLLFHVTKKSEKKEVDASLPGTAEIPWLVEVAAEVEQAGVAIATSLGTGDPAKAILSAADREDVDLIVMPTMGRRGLTRLTLGSVAESVLRRTKHPVLLELGREDLSGTVLRP